KTHGATGVNFLLYGLQDSGKTEAVKAAAKKAGITLYIVGEKGQGGMEPSRSARIQSAIIAQALLQDRKDAAILFDEMEDLLPNVGGGIFAPAPSAPSGISKVFLNRMLENNQTMTFWTANDPERFHPAVKRRMRFSIEFDIPPASVREQMWLSISARRDFNLSAADARKLAREYKAPPGMIDTAIRNAQQTGDVKTIRTSLAASADLVFGDRSQIIVRNPLPDYYNPALLKAAVDDSDLSIHELTARIEQSADRDFSMLLYGEPGTGKSAYAVHLANQLGMEVCLKKASDILGKYVGENEQNIARAFKEAKDGNKFLIVDEADTFLRSRSGAEKGWEISMVNEMLTQMESHPLPFAMTTNLYQDIDAAAKRRFLFKLKFSPLDAQQVKDAFREFFGMEAPDNLNKGPVPLAPADFALVKRQMRFLYADASAERLAELVKAEAKSRMIITSGYGESKAGFLGSLPTRKIG
ncbi:MAG TPA: AAA family ATPase, partial [Micavibrio sp.]